MRHEFLIRLAFGLYPRRWKERYGEEFAALLEDMDFDSSDAWDVLKGAAAMQLKRWLVAGVAVAGTCVLAGLTFFFAHHESRAASTQDAAAEFQRVRARFAGQSPVLDMRERRPLQDVTAPRPSVALHTFHTMIFDTRGGQRIVRINMPYSFGRFFGWGGNFQWLGQLTFLDDTEFDPEPIQLSLDQIAQHGPGLVVDYRHASGGQFIAWVD